MPTLERFNDIISTNINAEVVQSLPASVDASKLEFSVTCLGAPSGWVDATGKRTVTVVGNPTQLANEWGFVGTKDNYLQLNFKEEDLPLNTSFTAIAIGRHVVDSSYSTIALMGATGGTGGSTDPGLGYNGWDITVQRDATQTRSIYNVSVLRDLATDEYRQALFTAHAKGVNDVSRFRMHILRVDIQNRQIRAYDLAGYDGVGAVIPSVDFTLNASDVLLGRLRGKQNICLGNRAGYAGSDQCQFLHGSLFSYALPDAQIKDLVLAYRQQYMNNDVVNGLATLNGLTVAPGYTPINLFQSEVL